MKGSVSEYELSLFRQRSQAAIVAKAQRGALTFTLPAGLSWTPDGRIELNPDRRVPQAIRLVLDKLSAFGSVRQVLMWLRDERVSLPTLESERPRAITWRRPTYRMVLSMVRSPFYAGAYAFGRRESRTRVVDGRATRTSGHHKPMARWTALIRDHHPGYISWNQFERNQRLLEENTHMKGTMARKAGRGGQCLLAGLLRCARCGRMLHVMYGRRGYACYECRQANRAEAAPRCIAFLTVSAVLYNFDRSLEEAARSLGAGAFTTFRRVTLPIIKGGVISGAVFAFITSFDQFPISLLLSGVGTTTLPIQVFDYLRFSFDPTAAAVGTVNILITLGVVILTERLVGLESLYWGGRQ